MTLDVTGGDAIVICATAQLADPVRLLRRIRGFDRFCNEP
jgi:hypothetical protein